MRKSLFLAALGALALSFAGCSGGATTPPVASTVSADAAPVAAQSTTTSSSLSGKITWVSTSATKLQIQPSSGAAQYVYIQSATQLNYNGLAPKVGEYASAVGSGSPLLATLVTLSTSPITSTTSSTSTTSGSFAVSGKIVWVSSSATKLQVQPNSGAAQYVYIESTTKLNYNGLTPKVGEYAGANGSGSPLIATSVTISTSPISTTTSTIATPAPTATATPATPTSTAIKHITVIVMENNAYESIVGSSSAPYLNSLISRTAFFTSSSGVTHPSEPNYLAIFSGSTQGLTSDACPVSYSGANLATQLAGAGYSFAGYAENMPSTQSACEASASSYGSGYYYMRKHVPWASFTNVPSSDFHTWNGPGTTLSGTVNFITPNMCDDMHDCSTSTGDTWLSRNVPAIESWDNANNGLLIVTFDEGEYSSTNHVYTAFDGPMIKAGKYSQSINHYNVLRFIEDNFHLSHLGNAGSATAISGILK